MNGRGGLIGPRNQKWNDINQLLREDKIGVLCLQETHINEADVDTLHNLYGRRVSIWNSCSNTASSAQGVAIVLNRELTDVANVRFQELIPGRAILLRMHWHADRYLTILNVYAPNPPQENAVFWQTLLHMAEGRRYDRPDILAGDFNIVEEAIDRLPAKEDNAPAVQNLRALLHYFKLYDGWRLSEPTRKDFSFPQRGSLTRSRLDRIYATTDLVNSSHTWSIRSTGVQTDHRLASAALNTANAPYVGRGRWTMPLHLLSDDRFLQKLADLGKRTMTELRKLAQTEVRNPAYTVQHAHSAFKQAVQDMARQHMKVTAPKLAAEIRRLTEHLHDIETDDSYPSSTALCHTAAAISNRILDLERKRYAAAKLSTTTRYILNAEKVTKYWSMINKDRKPRDVIHALHDTRQTAATYVRRSDKMAELARDYHDSVQRTDSPGFSNDAQRTAMQSVLADIPSQLDGADSELLASEVSKDDIKRALKLTQTGRAAGLDGIPYEFWSAFARGDSSEGAYNSLEHLAIVFSDIDSFGLSPDSPFASGWMCPLYKKGDRREISNYRPITLLNSDYKTYTKVLTSRLGQVADKLIHKDQAGFVPGRHIEDQTQTC